jgi:hypothetical protein
MSSATAPCPTCGYQNRPRAPLCNLCQRIFVQTPRTECIERRLERRRSFYAEMAANQRRSALLLGLVIALLLLLGATIGEAVAPGGWPYGAGAAAVVALILWLVAFFQGDRIVLAASGAKPVTREAEPRSQLAYPGQPSISSRTARPTPSPPAVIRTTRPSR